MRFIRRREAASVIGVLAITVAVVLAAQAATSGQDQGAVKLEGAWIARVTSSPFPDGPYQWTYIMAPTQSGRSASLHGTVDLSFPAGIPHDSTTPIIGEIRQTGPDTAAFNAVWYGLNEGVVVFIGRSWGTARFLGRDRAEVQHNFEFYLPSADVDGDGLPDGPAAGAFSATSQDTRVPPPLP